MQVLPPSLALIGLFLLAIGFNAARTGRFAEGIQEGHPSRVLGWICVAFGLVLCSIAGWYLYRIWFTGY